MASFSTNVIKLNVNGDAPNTPEVSRDGIENPSYELDDVSNAPSTFQPLKVTLVS